MQAENRVQGYAFISGGNRGLSHTKAIIDFNG
jgi:hypothetical protein